MKRIIFLLTIALLTVAAGLPVLAQQGNQDQNNNNNNNNNGRNGGFGGRNNGNPRNNNNNGGGRNNNGRQAGGRPTTGRTGFDRTSTAGIGAVPTDFQLIATRNIFDPYRRPPSNFQTQPPTFYFTLAGTASWEDNKYAAFEGSIAPARSGADSWFKTGDSVNGYKINEITNDAVKLSDASNTIITMKVGMRMRRTNDGPWSLMPNTDRTAEPSSTFQTSGALDPGSSDVVRRLMERRAAEQGTPANPGGDAPPDAAPGTNATPMTIPPVLKDVNTNSNTNENHQ